MAPWSKCTKRRQRIRCEEGERRNSLDALMTYMQSTFPMMTSTDVIIRRVTVMILNVKSSSSKPRTGISL